MEVETLKQELSRMKNFNRRCLHKIKILRKQLSQRKIDHEILHNYNNDLKREIKNLKKRKCNDINSEKTKNIALVAKATAASMLQRTKELTDELLAFNDFLVQNSGNATIISSSPGYWINQIPQPSTSQNRNWNFMENGSSLTSIENNGINEEYIKVQPEEQSEESSSSSADESDSDESIFPTLNYPFKKRIIVEERLQNNKERPQNDHENQEQLPRNVEDSLTRQVLSNDWIENCSIKSESQISQKSTTIKTVYSTKSDSIENRDSSKSSENLNNVDFSGFEFSENRNNQLKTLRLLRDYLNNLKSS